MNQLLKLRKNPYIDKVFILRGLGYSIGGSHQRVPLLPQRKPKWDTQSFQTLIKVMV